MIKRCNDFRQALKSECVAIPGAFNGLVAKSVAENGTYPPLTSLTNKRL